MNSQPPVRPLLLGLGWSNMVADTTAATAHASANSEALENVPKGRTVVGPMYSAA